MKKLAVLLFTFLLIGGDFCFAAETAATEVDPAEQIIELTENKVIINVQKQPLNENSHQKIVMKKNWFVVNIQVNGKVKANPITSTYEVE